MIEWLVNEMVVDGALYPEQAEDYHNSIKRLRKAELQALMDKVKAKQTERTNETTDIETGDVMPPENTKYVWPSHLKNVAEWLERLGYSPGPVCVHLRGRVMDNELRVWFTQDYYMMPVPGTNRKEPNPDVREMLAKISNRARSRGFNTWFRPDHLAIWARS